MISSIEEDKKFLLLAIEEAKKGKGSTFPNPLVGAIIVKNGQKLSTGYHKKSGDIHAEVAAIQDINPKQLVGSTLYVTLEPCSTYGKTAPCTDLIIRSGIQRVVYGIQDPNLLHMGRADQILRNAGIQVESNVLPLECKNINYFWHYRCENNKPWVIAKIGRSLDGYIDSPPHRRWITSPRSREEVMHLRASVNGILIGAKTACSDNPLLTIRDISLPDNYIFPSRIIWAENHLCLPLDLKLLKKLDRYKTIILYGMNFEEALKEITAKNISSILLEGGSKTIAQAFKYNLVREIRLFIGPVCQGGLVSIINSLSQRYLDILVDNITIKKFDSDIMIRGLIK